jgi:hypothetical protein
VTGWWEWVDGETPVVLPVHFCERCGAQLEIVGPFQTRQFDARTGQPIIDWRLRCPNRVLGFLSRHDDKALLPHRTAIAPSIDVWSGQKPVYASVDPGRRVRP